MNWGSSWEFTDYTRQNWWNLWIEDADNAGGSSFAASQQSQKQSARNEPNPFLRTRAPGSTSEQSTAPTSEISSQRGTEREYIYATESFDRQQPVSGIATDSRWLADSRRLKVPVVEDRQVVAFQKALRDEEAEFLLLLLAAEDEEIDGYIN